MSLQKQIEELASRDAKDYSDQDGALFNEFKAALNRGEIRAAERDADGKWRTNARVKRGILLGFRMGAIVEMTPSGAPLQFLDKDTYPIRRFSPDDRVRGEISRRSADAPLEIPAGAVVVPGSRAIQTEKGREWGLSLYAPVIVKYRDEKTDAATQLEEALR